MSDPDAAGIAGGFALDPAELAEQAEDAAADGPWYPNAADWVRDWLIPHVRRDLPGVRWCRYWWKHAEAASRLEALWQAWEAARADEDDPAAMSHWWLYHADQQLALLFSNNGPFIHCDRDSGEHRLPDQLPTVEPPEGMYRDRDHPEEAHADELRWLLDAADDDEQGRGREGGNPLP